MGRVGRAPCQNRDAGLAIVIISGKLKRQPFRMGGFPGECRYNELFYASGDDTARIMGACLPIGDHVLAVGLHRSFGQETFGADKLGRLKNLVDPSRR